MGDKTYSEGFVYDDHGRLTSKSVTLANGSTSTMTNTYDALSRLSAQTRPMSRITYSYLAGANGTTTGLVSSVTHSKVGSNSFSPITFGYAYDELGYITSYTQIGKQDVTYDYDQQGQLTSVIDPNQDLYYSYEYDTYGNIRTAEAHGSYHISDDYTNDYEYNNPKWLDLLTGFNTEPILYEGQTLVDGEIVGDPTSGNPISYFNGTRWEFTWQNGRQLASASTTDGDTTIDIDYTYDINGLRTSKTITRTTTTEEEDDGHTHTYTTTVVEPTCTEDGYTLYECECGYSYTDNVVDATGHTYSSVVTAPTCLNAGYTTYTCTCGDSYTDNVVDALGHNYVESETETGSVFTCSRCGDSYTGHQHTYTGSVVAPTCIMRGYTVYTCSCGDTYMGNYVPALGHDGVEVGRTQTMITYLCNRCGATYQEPIVVDPNPPVEMSLRRSTVSVETEHHEYVYASGKLLREVITTTDVDGNVTTETLDFTYDASGSPYTVTRIVGTSSSTYYYVVNAQGDVIRLVSANGATVAEYAYDPWGRVTSASGTMAEANPLRYRGYYYDAETEFYYLQSRYYDSTACRFVNADGLLSTGQDFLGCNMFAYCNGNPINLFDPSGSAGIWSYLFRAHQFGLVHFLVACQISATYPGVHAECWLRDSNGGQAGRADLVSEAGYVWEIKSGGSAKSEGPTFYAKGMRMAQDQALGYLGKTTKRNNIPIMDLGPAYAFTGSFTIAIDGDVFLVTYTTPTNGVVLYTVDQLENYSGKPNYAYNLTAENNLVKVNDNQPAPSNFFNPISLLMPIPAPMPLFSPAGGYRRIDLNCNFNM